LRNYFIIIAISVLLFLLLFLFYERRWFFALQTSNQIRFNTKISELFSRRNNYENQINNFEFEFSKIYSTLKLKQNTLSNNLLYFHTHIPHQTKKILQFKKSIFIVSFLVFLLISPFPFGEIEPAYAFTSPAVIMLSGAAGDLDATIDTDVTWGNEDREDAGFTHATNGATITVTDSGIYRVMYALNHIQSGTDRALIQAHLEVNGADAQKCYGGEYVRGNSIIEGSTAGSCLVELSASDTIGIVSKTDVDQTTTFVSSGDKSYFHVYKVDNDVILLRDSGTTSITSGQVDIPMDTTDEIDTASFTYGGSDGNITVDTTGYYLISYSLAADYSTTRGMMLGNIEINNVESEFCSDTQQVRSNLVLDIAVVTASCIESLTASDVINLRVLVGGATSATARANEIHLDAEFLGADLTVANVLRVSDTDGDQSTDAVITLDWDTEEDKGDKFTFTATSTDLEVEEAGIYHISYSVLQDHDVNGRHMARGEILVDGTPADECYGGGAYAKAANDATGQGSTTNSCLIELTANQVVTLQLTDESSTSTSPLTEANRVGMSIYALTGGNTPPNTPTDITCDAGTCNTSFDASVTLVAVGTDPDADNITFEFEASLDATTSVPDTDDDVFTVTGSAGSVTFVAAGTLSTENDNSGTTVSVTFPAHDAGDLLIAVVGLSNGNPNLNPAETMNAETGWTKMTEGTWSSTTAGSTTVFYNFDEDDSITTVEFDSTGTTGYVAKGFAYRGVDTSTPIDVGPTYLNDQGGASSIAPPDITTVTDGAMAIVITNRDGNPVALTPSSGYDERSDEGNSGPGDGVMVHLADNVIASAGLESPGDVTWSGSQENNAMSFALRPEPGDIVDGSTSAVTTQDVDGDHDSITSIQFEVALSAYTNSGSVAASNSNPDILLEVWDGSSWDSLGNFGFDEVETLSITVNDDGGGILSGWKTSTDQDFRLTGVLMDHDGGSNQDSITVTSVTVTIIGDKWTSAGSYTQPTASVSWESRQM